MSFERFHTEWRRLADAGVFAPFADPSRFAEGCDALEALAYGETGLGLFVSIVSGCGLALPILNAAGRDTTRVVRGERVLGVAITESTGGSDVLGMKTRVVPDGGAFVLTGEKWCITNAPVADDLIVFCRHGEGEHTGLSAVLVPARREGVTIEPLALGGAIDSPTGAILFDRVRVSADDFLGVPERGRELLEAAFLRERLLAPWPLIGRMRRALEDGLDRAAERHQFGAPIARYQYVQDKLVGTFERLETTRLLAEEARRRFLAGEMAGAHASLAKNHAAESAAATFAAMLELHGASGALERAGLTSAIVDAHLAGIAGGTKETHKKVIFQQLVLARARAKRGVDRVHDA